ncbi:MAG TPA: DNA-directed RNA polymerase subunit P [archaeon]|nr:DNA-directed RNA polymerase subunit P [archaeon]
MYKCLTCGKHIDLEQITDTVRCPFCGFRIIQKERPKTLRKVKAV